MSCDVICLAMLYVLRCYMSCDVICLAMLYVLRCYMSISKKHKPQKNKKQKQKQKKESGENNMYCSLVFPFLPCIFFCHSFLHFVTHFYKNGKVNKTRETRI